MLEHALDANVFDYTAGVIKVKDSAREPTWRVSLGWQATPTVFAYATYSRGFKAGGFNDQIGSFHPFVNADGSDNPAAFAAAASATKPERADSYEAGVKTELFDRHLRFNLTGFYVDYNDLQKQIVVPLVVGGQQFQVTRFFNAAKATVKGIELESTLIPVQGLTLRGLVGYQDGKYKSYVTPIPAGYDLSSAPLDRLPKWQWTADATYELPIGDFKLQFNGNINYVARNLFTQSITSPAENTFLNARTLYNASITLMQADDKYYVRLIGRNLSDKRYLTGSQVVGGLWANGQYGPPRYFGAEVGFKLGN
ncbi:TonB-dependent receptor domain-containing protein [Rhizorhabdus histidinilytica]